MKLNKLKQDSFILGLILGIITPFIMFGIIWGIDYFLRLILNMPILISISTMQLVAIVSNVFIMRLYMVKFKFDKTGRGILLLTFIYILAYFVNDYLIK